MLPYVAKIQQAMLSLIAVRFVSMESVVFLIFLSSLCLILYSLLFGLYLVSYSGVSEGPREVLGLQPHA